MFGSHYGMFLQKIEPYLTPGHELRMARILNVLRFRGLFFKGSPVNTLGHGRG